MSSVIYLWISSQSSVWISLRIPSIISPWMSSQLSVSMCLISLSSPFIPSVISLCMTCHLSLDVYSVVCLWMPSVIYPRMSSHFLSISGCPHPIIMFLDALSLCMQAASEYMYLLTCLCFFFLSQLSLEVSAVPGCPQFWVPSVSGCHMS